MSEFWLIYDFHSSATWLKAGRIDWLNKDQCIIAIMAMERIFTGPAHKVTISYLQWIPGTAKLASITMETLAFPPEQVIVNYVAAIFMSSDK